jgi:hypothetical protein
MDIFDRPWSVGFLLLCRLKASAKFNTLLLGLRSYEETRVETQASTWYIVCEPIFLIRTDFTALVTNCFIQQILQ